MVRLWGAGHHQGPAVSRSGRLRLADAGLIALAGAAAALLLVLALSYRDSARCTDVNAQRHRVEAALARRAPRRLEHDRQQFEPARQDMTRYCR